MVITVFWVPSSWSVPVISITVLCVAVMFLLCCFCFQKKRGRSLELGIQSHRNFLSIPGNSLNKLMFFRNLDSNKNLAEGESRADSESDLLENEDASKRFSNSCLKIEDLDEIDQDVKSCDSGDSRFTFYSTYPFNRSVSAVSDTATYKSMRNSLATIPCGSRPASSSDTFTA